MNRIYFLFVFLLFVRFANSQNISSIQDGPWDLPSTWAGGVVPDESNSDVITIDHNVFIQSGFSFSIDGTTINAGASLTVRTGGTLDIVGTPGALTVNGDLTKQNNSTITNDDGTNIVFNTGSFYHHLNTTTEGVIPLASWDPNATLSIEGYTTFNSATTNGNWGQDFGNVLWNCAAANTTLNLNGLLVSIMGDLTVSNTNTGTLQLTNVNNTNISIGGSLSILNKSKFNATTTATGIVIGIGGDLIYTSTATTATTIAFATTGKATINLAGNFIMTGGSLGSFALSNGASGTGTLNIDGDFTINSGTFTLNSTAVGNVNFNGTGIQQFTMNGTIPTNRAFNYTIASTSTLDMIGESYMGASATGSLVVNGTIRLGSTTYSRGALVTGTLGGNVKMSAARTFNSGSTIVYAGSSAQIVGGGHPTTSGVNMEVDNPAGVTLDNTATTGSALANLTIGGNLILTSGNLNIDTSPSTSTRTLTINGNISANGNNITVAGTRTDIVINGTGALGIFPFPSGAQTFRNYSINRTSSGSVDFSNDLALTGAVTCTAGDTRFNGSATTIASTLTMNGGTIDFNGTGTVSNAFTMNSGTIIYFEGQTLTLNGTLSGTGGLLSSNSNSTLNLTGGVAYGTLAFSPSGNSLGSLTINRTGGTNPRVTLNSALTITNSLTITAGNFANVSGLTMASGSTITRASTSLLTTTIPSGGPYNVSYTGTSSPSTSIEAHGTVNNFSVNVGAANTVSGDAPITISGQLHIIGGTFSMSSASTFTAASFINDAIFRGGTANLILSSDFANNGTFNANTGTVTFSGTTNLSGTTPPSLYNVVISGTANALADFAVLNNFTNNGVFSSGTGTVTFNGVGAQDITGAAITTFNNITVTNTVAAVRVQSSQNLKGVLTLTGNPTTFDADGTSNTSIFTLLSTGDNPTADASIATLGTGASVTGSVTVQRYMAIEGANSGRIYRYISSPVINATVADIQNEIPVTGTFTGNSNSSCSGCSTATQSMFGYTESTPGVFDNGYFNFPSAANTETFSPGRGYTIYVRGSILSSALWDLRGSINQGNVSMPVTYTAVSGISEDGWNLVGNPYPSTIDWDSPSWTRSGLDGTVYIRDNGQTTPVYATYTAGGGGVGVNGGSRYIATGQAFWVKATSAPTLTATEAVKAAGTSTKFIRSATPTNLLRITMRNAINRDETVIRFLKDATTDFDNNLDAWKLMNSTFNLSSVSNDGKKLAISSLPVMNCLTNVALDVSNTVGTYKLDFTGIESFSSDVQLSLYDRFLDKTTDIRAVSSYEFQVTADKASFGSARFSVNVCGPTQNIVTANETEIASAITVYPNPAENELNVEIPSGLNVQSVKMFSNFGVELISELALSEHNGVKKGRFNVDGLPSGLYIVRVLQAGKWSNIKVSKK